MAYIKKEWLNQNVERQKTYRTTKNEDGSITLTESFGNVVELGTPVNADNMNHIENGIKNIELQGISPFDAEGSYQANYLCQFNGKIYQSLTDNNQGNQPNESPTDWKEFQSGGGLPIGAEIALHCSASYVPKGCLPKDGTEYDASLFQGLWDNYLTAQEGEEPRLLTCTYEEYQQDLETYGQCAKFAVDIINQKFKTPLKKNGSATQQALSDDELGKSYNAGLPNITGTAFNIGTNYNDVVTEGAFQKTSSSNNYGYATSGYAKTHLHLDASHSSSIYGNSDTVQMDAQALRFFVVVANGEIDNLTIDWSNWASNLQGKLNTDVSNLSNFGAENIAQALAPDWEQKIDLNYQILSNNPYTVPDEGYYACFSYARAQSTWIYLVINGVQKCAPMYSGNLCWGGFFRVSKGDVLYWTGGYYESGSPVQYFVPMKGV